jgi:transglutaminase-like putative cysteine protease
MIIRLGFEMAFESPTPTPMLLLLSTSPDVQASLLTPDTIHATPDVPMQEFRDSFGNRCTRLVAPTGSFRLTSDFRIQDSGFPDRTVPDAPQVPLEDLPPDTLQFLLSSRYCEVDKIGGIAWELFGNTLPGWARVQAICDWVHENIEYGYAFASPFKTAMDVYEERRGVCRDFQHLSVAFCRALNIPARYVGGYLGDIRIPPVPTPMDFHAWFEAYLGGQWYAFDARHNVPRVGRVPMSKGRDATDTALTTAFGDARLTHFAVISEEVEE